MGAWQRFLGAAIAVFALVCALSAWPSPALASSTQDSIITDDNQLVYNSPSHVAHVLEQLKALGFDRVHATVNWQLVAPRGFSRRRPKFNAANPSAYPPGAWNRYDLLARLTHRLGMTLYFQLTPPSPSWATTGQPADQGPILGRYPHLGEWRQFIEAVGRRYSGSFVTKVPRDEPRVSAPSGILPQLLGGGGGSGGGGGEQSDAIPRVNYWGIWNEPNERSWLNPWHRGRDRNAFLQPSRYRRIVDVTWNALKATGHGRDTILVGETANVGTLTPLPFIRDVYCVSSSDRPLTGRSAARVGCPTSGNRGRFVRTHPGLFKATGFAHHPYGFDIPPNRPYPDRSWITTDNIGVLEHVLTRIRHTYGQRGSMPLYLTEWGFKTKPPNPYVRTTLADQAAWLDLGDYLTWRKWYVRGLDQFELVDDKPKPHTRRGTRAYWSTFQTGLEFRGGTPKPAYRTFPIPIWLPSARHGRHVALWGQLRPANHSGTQFGALLFRPRHGQWRILRLIQTSNRRGFLYAHVGIPSAGWVRLQWSSSPKQAYGQPATYYSRIVRIR